MRNVVQIVLPKSGISIHFVVLGVGGMSYFLALGLKKLPFTDLQPNKTLKI